MALPVIRGVIARRILVNYQVDPSVLAGLLPAPFRPQLFRGRALVGICLIRLEQVRPAFMPAWTGITSENAAHRAAVEWDDAGVTRSGVYVRRRDTSSWLNSIAGGRVFPGLHHHATFTVQESTDHFSVELRSDDGETHMAVEARTAEHLPPTSVFASLDEASRFFQAGSLGYSATPTAGRFQGLELKCLQWQVEPLETQSVVSSFFDDRRIFPAGSIELDCALLMRGIEHEWHGKTDLCCAQDPLRVPVPATAKVVA